MSLGGNLGLVWVYGWRGGSFGWRRWVYELRWVIGNLVTIFLFSVHVHSRIHYLFEASAIFAANLISH